MYFFDPTSAWNDLGKFFSCLRTSMWWTSSAEEGLFPMDSAEHWEWNGFQLVHIVNTGIRSCMAKHIFFGLDASRLRRMSWVIASKMETLDKKWTETKSDLEVRWSSKYFFFGAQLWWYKGTTTKLQIEVPWTTLQVSLEPQVKFQVVPEHKTFFDW